MESTLYLVRYGAMGHVGRFGAGPAAGDFERGQSVVLETARGTELGEILAPVLVSRQEPPPGVLILRAAGPDDLARARLAEHGNVVIANAAGILFGLFHEAAVTVFAGHAAKDVVDQFPLQAGDWIRLGAGGPLLRFLGATVDRKVRSPA